MIRLASTAEPRGQRLVARERRPVRLGNDATNSLRVGCA